MFELENEQFDNTFEFNSPFRESADKWELDQLWTNINSCKNDYLITKDRNLIFFIDFFLTQLVHLNKTAQNSQQYQLKIQLSELFNELFQISHDLPKNQWLLIILMKQFKLGVDRRVENRVNLLITLNDCSTLYDTNKLVKYIERNPKDLDEEKLLIKLRRLLKENPHLGALVIKQFNQYFESDEINSKLREYTNLDFLIGQSFKDVEEKNFFLTCDFLNILPDNDLRDADLLKILNDYELIFSESSNQTHLVERFYTSILGRDTESLAYKISELNWSQRKNRKSIDNILVCLYFILFDKRYLMSELYLESSLDNYDVIPEQLKLFYLVNKIYNSRDKNLDQLKQLVDNFKLKKVDRIEEYVVLKLRWIFKFLNWITEKCDGAKNENAESRKISYDAILGDLLNSASTLSILLKYNLLPILDEQDEDFSLDVMELIVDCKNKSELMLWKGFIVIRLAIIWMINGKNDEDDLNEIIPLQIRNHMKKILPLNYRAELLENLFSLLFLNQDDLLMNNEETDSTPKSTSRSNSLANLTNLIQPTNEIDLNIKLNKLLDNDDEHNQSKKSNKNTFAFFQTSDNFIFPNELVYEFILLLKDCTLQTQSTLVKFQCKLNEEELKRLETEFNLDCSIKDLKETRKRLENLLEHLNFAELRFSVLEPAFFQQKQNNEIISYTSTVSETTTFDDVSNDEDIEFESMNDTLGQRSQTNNRTVSFSHHCNTNQSVLNKSNYGITHSIISCMLAPHDQLLRFCLIEDHLEKAKQVYNLFFDDLKTTNEALELFVLENWHTLALKTYEIYSTDYRQNKELFRMNLICFLDENFLNQIRCKYPKFDIFSFLFDFGLTSAASLEISHILIEIAEQQQANRSNERVLEFSKKFKSLLELFHTNKQYSNLSVSSVLDRCMDINIFESPLKFDQELEKKQNLIKCVNEIRDLLSLDSSFDSIKHLDPDSPTNNKTTVVNLDLRKLTQEYKKLLNLCASKKFNYLKALFYYVQKVTKVLQECKKRSDQYCETGKSALDSLLKNSTSYFSVLYQSPSAILYSMVVKHRISPRFLDDLAKEMKVDLLSTLCNDLLPSIPASSKQEDLHLEFSINDCLHPALTKLVSNHLTGNNLLRQDSFLIQNHFDEDSHTEMIYKYEVIQTLDLIEYFRSKSWILVKIMQLLNLIDVNMAGFKNTIESKDCFVENSPLIRWITIVQQIFDSDLNKKLGVDISILSLLPCLTPGNLTIIKCLEKFAQYSNWKKMYDALLIVDLNNVNDYSSFNSLKTALLSKIALETGDIKYALQIKDARKRTKLMLNIIENTDLDLYANSKTAIEDLSSLYSTLEQRDESDQEFKEIKKTVELAIKRVQVYTKIAELSGLRTWKEAIENLSEIDILTILKTRHTYNIVIEWNEVYQFYNNFNLNSGFCDREIFFETDELRKELLIIAYSEKRDIESINELIKSHNSPVNLFEKILNSVDNLDCKEFITKLILERKNSEIYKNHLLGVRMIKNLSENKRPYYMPIIYEPQLIFEQMLMNIELGALEKCIRMEVNEYTNEFNDLIEIYAKKSVDIVLVKDSVSISGSDTTMISSNYYLSGSIGNFLSNSFNNAFNNGSNVTNTTVNESLNQSFVMPASIPSRSQWMSDHKVMYCMVCKIERFSMFNRKHHCRRCGRVICRNCSLFMLISQINPQNPVRVCEQCYAQSTNSEPYLPMPSSSQSNSSRSNQTRKESYTYSVPNRCTVEWILTLNQQENDLNRDEFYYEAAPSSSLCLSILKLHQDKKRCAQIITDHLCRPLFETLSSREIDYGLVINIIKSLVNSAKVIISEETDCSDLNTKIDFLLDRIDIIKMLVDGNCLDYDLIYTLINNEQAFQKVQEKLIEMERFELALSISTKIGTANLKAAIWKTWAMISIKHGKYLESYAKFKHCFQKKTNEPNQQNSQLLKEIFDVLESQRVFVNLHNLKDCCKLIKQGKCNNLINVDMTMNEDLNLLPNSLYQHAIYFLDNYGSSEDYLRFYIKFQMFKQAIQLFLSETSKFDNFSPIFVNEFFLPSINNHTLDKILNQLSLLDPTLNKSWRYLIAVCKYLSANKFYSILHKLQLFMRDYIRAAMTKITYFYLSPPPSDYVQLFHRNDNLMQAREHCRQYIVSEPELNKGCLRIPKEDALKQIHTLNMQMDITCKFYDMGIKGYLTNDHLILDDQQQTSDNETQNEQYKEFMNSSSAVRKEPLTLLTDSKTKKTYLAALVAIESSATISQSFELAQQIIKDNNLNVNLVYRVAAKILINSKKKHIVQLIEQFVECIKKSEREPSLANQYCDDFICVCIRHTNNNDLVDPLIKMLNNDENKINCYILVGKLKSAYLLAVKSERKSDITRIMSVAEATKQDSIKNICERWLKKFNK